MRSVPSFQEHATSQNKYRWLKASYPTAGKTRGALQVERYIFFPACAERFGLQSPGLLREGRDEDSEQGMLHSALQVLEEVSSTALGSYITSHHNL